MAGACSLAATLAVTVRKLQEGCSDTIGNGATEATARKDFATHSSRLPF